jgi:hypothetical protein
VRGRNIQGRHNTRIITRTVFAAQAGHGLNKARGEAKANVVRARFAPTAITLRRARGTVLGKGHTWVAVVTIGT